MFSRPLSLWLILLAIAAWTAGMYVCKVHDSVVDSYQNRGSDAAYSLELFLNGRLQALRIMAEQPELASFDARIVRPRLMKLTENWGLRNAALFDAEGRFVTSVDASHPPFVNDYPSFARALKGDLVVSNRITRKGHDVPFISLRVPVRDETGNAVGVLSAGVSSNDIAKIVGAMAPSELMILDGTKALVYHDNLAAMMANESAIKFFSADLFRLGRVCTYNSWPFENVSKLFVSVPVRGTEWLLVAAVPTNTVLLTVAGKAFSTVAALALAFFCTGLLAYSWNEARKHRNELDAQRMHQLASINQLAAGIAHEIRNPLTSIKGFIQFSLTKPDRPVNVDHMGLVLAEVERIERLINEFRLLARPQETSMVTTDVTAGLGHVTALLSSEALAKAVALEYHPPYEALIMTGNDGMLKQLWINLIRNAIDAVPYGGKVEIEAARKHDHCVVMVKDNGMGIPEDNLSRLGTPFFTTKANGTGLGLSVSYGILHKHRGTIEFDSTTHGTVVTVSLPLAKGGS